jgi:hypothetical protein
VRGSREVQDDLVALPPMFIVPRRAAWVLQQSNHTTDLAGLSLQSQVQRIL